MGKAHCIDDAENVSDGIIFLAKTRWHMAKRFIPFLNVYARGTLPWMPKIANSTNPTSSPLGILFSSEMAYPQTPRKSAINSTSPKPLGALTKYDTVNIPASTCYWLAEASHQRHMSHTSTARDTVLIFQRPQKAHHNFDASPVSLELFSIKTTMLLPVQVVLTPL